MRLIAIVFVSIALSSPAFADTNLVSKKSGIDKDVVVEMVQEKSLSGEDPTPRVLRIVDTHHKIVCYIVDGSGYSGFSCVPTSTTK